ncbi:hypothetical protein Mapa_007657 [Marchantia paleacea]|nr:hypothetical protein Mapa_007657 [Marchantia paleacea]
MASWRSSRIHWERWFIFVMLCFFVGMLSWVSPVGELRQLRWRVVGLHYELQHSDQSMVPYNDFPLLRPSDSKRVAICLVGGARAFELTGPSIKQYLLDPYEDADVFVHSPVDKDVHKLTLLEGFPHLAAIRLFHPKWINETKIASEVLTARGSPKGIQGLLQYFQLVEGCLDMIQAYERLHGFSYAWVIRTRVDGYWNAPMPQMEFFKKSYYYVPHGSGYGGLNDRLGVGTRELSTIALSRMALLPKIHELGYRGLYSETAFQAQFTSCNVEVKFSTFPFCVLSTRKYPWPPKVYGVPVMSIGSKGPLNGAKCRPCTPLAVGRHARSIVNASDRSVAWVGPTEDPQLCDARGDWEDQWEGIFDEISGPDAADARKKISSRTFDECVRDVEDFQQQWEVWDAPSSEILCGIDTGKESKS